MKINFLALKSGLIAKIAVGQPATSIDNETIGTVASIVYKRDGVAGIKGEGVYVVTFDEGRVTMHIPQSSVVFILTEKEDKQESIGG